MIVKATEKNGLFQAKYTIRSFYCLVFTVSGFTDIDEKMSKEFSYLTCYLPSRNSHHRNNTLEALYCILTKNTCSMCQSHCPLT